ncbi:hypothetical protein GIB67_012545 [Kingdonia uniflora]|uniref:Uncharacterized protein n=1 Tax=Kingdonia uniflora TaxID=39325 RepID=A0A7J7N5I3_9MAGN|nr:hypothetical protein GIB67_012545 [Kingdonia uniflora]
MGQPKIEKLKKWILRRICVRNNHLTEESLPFNLSALVVTAAYVWVYKIKALRGYNEREHFLVLVGHRSRPDHVLPITYFGNCLVLCLTTIERNDLVGEDGVVVAVEVIGNAIQRTCKAVLNGLENYLANLSTMASERITGIVGSPKLRFYDINFGWGKPKQVKVISYTSVGAIFISERSDGEVGLEVGIALEKFQMDAFASLFENSLKDLPLKFMISFWSILFVTCCESLNFCSSAEI